jgi:hypothetical protein
VGTVLRVGRFVFRIYSNEPHNEPPHVHVLYGRDEAKFSLMPVRLIVVRGMSEHDVRDAERLVHSNRDHLERKYRELHPNT